MSCLQRTLRQEMQFGTIGRRRDKADSGTSRFFGDFRRVGFEFRHRRVDLCVGEV